MFEKNILEYDDMPYFLNNKNPMNRNPKQNLDAHIKNAGSKKFKMSLQKLNFFFRKQVLMFVT